jgi:MoxR-like ATPase
MTKFDTLLIKIGHSYREGMSDDELYLATSVSWKISEDKLQSGDYKYYCAVFNNKIKEIYELTGYEKDLKPENIGRIILKGKKAEDSIRSRLLELDVSDVHKGLGNPIKYQEMENLLKMADSNSKGNDTIEEMPNNCIKELFKQLFINLAKEKNEIKTLVSNKSNWITNVNKSGLFVETNASREKHLKGEKQNPYYFIPFDFIVEGWEEFIAVKKTSAKDFVKTKGRSSFMMAFFNELPFVEKVVEENTVFIKLKEFTTDQLPEASLDQVTDLLSEVMQDNLDPRSISQKYNDDTTKRLKSRARQGLKILGFTDETYSVSESTLNEYKQSINKTQFLSKKIRQSNYLSVIFDLLTYLNGVPKHDKLSILSEIGMLIVRNSLGQNQMVKSVAEYRTRNILNWFKETGMVDESWNRLPLEYHSNVPNADRVKDNNPITLPIKKLIEHIDNYISSKGFYYEKQEIMNLYLSLRTKPFVIISGISGTGKTMLIKWVAESIGATAENGQFALIPVRPDWNDGSDLLGYVDIAGNFKEGPLTTVIKRAVENPVKPYFVLLDEMNLARVEYYFSDILSVMESREKKNGTIISLSLFKDLIFPENVYIIGTVNMDETTHPFSKKVLDRANTIEFNRVNLDFLDFLRTINHVESIHLHNHSLVSSYIHLKDVYNVYSDLVVKASQKLVEINNILKTIGAHVGYRVRDEICFYLAYNQQGELMTFEEAFDNCILQKILPRISGSDSRVERLLKNLFTLFTHRDYSEEPEIDEESISMAIYPKSARKVYEMLGRLEDGFTSFWIS